MLKQITVNSDTIHQEILDSIEQSNSIIITSHRSPDGDALGSMLALAHYLEKQNKSYACYNIDEVGPALEFLPKVNEVKQHDYLWQHNNYDLVIVVDSGDLSHAAIDHHINNASHNFTVINIDHHVTNEQFGHHNLVIDTASSTCEIVYHLLKNTQQIDKNIATCLLTGIITDTGAFSNLATTSEAISTASELLSHGANLPQIAKHTLNHRPYNALKLWGRALERLHEDPKTGMIVTALSLEDIQNCHADKEAVSGISNFLNSLEQASEKAILVLTQSVPGIIKGSLRTTNPLLDVSEFAKLYGGGGHKKAAGFTINGTLIITNNSYEIIPPSN